LLDIVAIQQDIEDALGIRVDVVTERSLSPHIRDSILSDALPLQKQD
jgi:predicted nucleotidyltransferase